MLCCLNNLTYHYVFNIFKPPIANIVVFCYQKNKKLPIDVLSFFHSAKLWPSVVQAPALVQQVMSMWRHEHQTGCYSRLISLPGIKQFAVIHHAFRKWLPSHFQGEVRAAIIHFLLLVSLSWDRSCLCSVQTLQKFPFPVLVWGFGNFQKNTQNKSHWLKVQNAFLWSSCLRDLASTAFSKCGILGLACKPVAFDVKPQVTHTELGILFIPTKRLVHRKIHCIFFFPSSQVWSILLGQAIKFHHWTGCSFYDYLKRGWSELVSVFSPR